MKVILILCFSDLKRDPRVYRQILALKDNYKIIAAGYQDPQLTGVDFVQLHEIPGSFYGKLLKFLYLKLRLFEKFYWSKKVFSEAYHKLKKQNYALILANDSDALPLSVRLAKEKTAKLIYDAHEYTPLELEGSWKWRFFWQKYRTYLCKRYLAQVDVLLTVCDGIALEYQHNFGVMAQVIINAPEYVELSPYVVNNQQIRIIHHGAAIRERKLELMLEVASQLDERFSLDLMLMANDKKYYDELKKMASNLKNVRFIDPVPMPEIAQFINRYDIGLCMIPPTNFNYKYALANKFFEFIQGRLMLAIGPLIEMVKFVNKYDLGIVTKTYSPKEMAVLLNQLIVEDVYRYKLNSNKVAWELSFNNNKQYILEIVKQLLTD